MRRLIFLALLLLLSFSLTVGCSSKKRTRKGANSDNQTADAGQAQNQDPNDQAAGGDAANDNAGGDGQGNQNAGADDGSPANNAPPPGVTNRGRPRGMRPGDNLTIGGIPNPPPGGAGNAGAPGRSPGVRRPRGMRPGDNLSIGGVGNIPNDVPRGPRLDARGRPIVPRAPRNNANAGEAFAGGGLPNGFFPQPSGGGTTFDSDGAPANGFFPQSMGGGVVAAPPPPAPSSTFRSAAQSAFQERRGQEGMNNMYAYILSEEKNVQKYPLRYFPGINKAKVALKWGIGVVYTNKSENSTPLVIGDPEGMRETSGRSRSSSRSRGGGRGNRGGAGSFEAPGGANRQQANSSNSDYATVNVENPEGFLLYYTGDYGDRFLTRLESRLNHEEGFYGDIYRDFQTDYSSESTGGAGTRAPVRRQGVRRQRRRNDNLSVGGGGNRGGNRGGIGGPAGGNNGGSSRSKRLERLLTSSQASAPASDTTGLIMPGVFLVGEGKSNILFERAKNMDIDVLAIFTVRVSTARKSTGTTSLKIYNLHSGEKPERIIDGRALRSDKVADQREGLTDASRDPVELALDDVFADEEGADVILKAVDIPDAIKSQKEGLKNRVETMSKNKPKNVLPAIIEILNYKEMGLVDEKVIQQSLNRLMGGVLGDTYSEGDAKAKADILKRFVNKAAPSNDGFR